MANNNETILSSDIYDISEFVNTIQKNNSDLEENTLSLGIFGYLNDMFTISTQNTVRMTAEYSNEAIATRAKYPKNVITHALNLGIKDINATPATIKTLILVPEDYLLERLSNDKFILDSNCKIYLGEFEFHFDYDIIIRRTQLADLSVVYTAMYDMSITNELSDITNPYLPPIGIFKYYGNNRMLALTVQLRQVEYREVIKKIITDNPLENKVMNFTFDEQLASFNLDVYESDEDIVHLTPVYEGLYDETPGLLYCNYSYLNSDTIRVKFDRDSYEPMLNCEVHINIKETKGSAGNFKFVDDVQVDLESEKINYDGMYIIVKPIGTQESSGGIDKKSVEQLKKIIPKEALAHGTIINTQDLENFFNQIDDENCKLYFYKNKDNPLTRLYYAYIVTKQDNNIIPTNTINIAFTKDEFNESQITEDGNIIMKPGNLIYLKPGDGYARLVSTPLEEDESTLDKEGFLYMNPFLCIINKKPLYTSYILDIINVEKDLEFTYINQDSEYQFIASTVDWYRQFFTDRDKYKMDIKLLQNINNEDSGILIVDPDTQKVIGAEMKIIAVFYDSQEIRPFRWIEAEYQSFEEDDFIFNYQFVFETDNVYDNSNRIKILNMKDMNSDRVQFGYNKEKVKCKILVLAKFPDKELGRKDWDKWIPNLEGYTLTNEYDISDKLELFYNYTQIMASDIKLTQYDPNIPDSDPGEITWYSIMRMPCIRKLFVKNEKRMNSFIKDVERRRRYIETSVLELEDSFGVDLKFFNTYGPSTLFYLEDGTNINRTSLSMTFKMKPYSMSDVYIKDNIILDIKEYLEDINDIKDFHAPNLTTYIETKYKDQLVYFEFVDINGYGPGNQHIYMPESYHGDVVPEFLNININNEDEPDITINVISATT